MTGNPLQALHEENIFFTSADDQIRVEFRFELNTLWLP